MNQVHPLPSSRPTLANLGACCFLCLAGTVGVPGQVIVTGVGQMQGQPASQKKVRLTGMVVNTATGEGVGKAKVDVLASAGVSVFTGSDGHFEVESVPEGQWQVMARKPGYFNDQELSRGAYRPKLFAATENGTGITVRLTPAAAVAGHVVGDKGEPVESAQVEVIASTIDNGRRIWQQRSGAQTDDNGDYSLSGLIPGDYYVRVRPGAVDSLGRPSGSAYDEVYAGCYYPAAATQDQAAIVHLTGGQQTQTDFTLSRVKAYRVFGHVSMQGTFAVVIAFRGEEETGVRAGVRKDGRFTLAGLTTGQYSIVAVQNNQQQPLFGEEQVTISQGDVKNVEVFVQRPQSIPVQIQVVKTRDAPAQNSPVEFYPLVPGVHSAPNNGPAVPIGNIVLKPVRPTAFRMNYAQVNPNNPGSDEQLALKGALPGAYRVDVQPFQPYYVESIRSGGLDLLDQPLIVSQGGATPPIQIVLRDDSATLAVKVMEDGQPATSGVLLMVPAAHPSETARPLNWGGSGPSVSGLAPGDYRVYAFDSIEDLEYANPEVLREFAGKSQLITLEPNGSAAVTLELVALNKQRGAP
jgi:hypothetical protein